MSHLNRRFRPNPIALILLSGCCVYSLGAMADGDIVVEEGGSANEEILIDDGEDGISIEEGTSGGDGTLIEDAPADNEPVSEDVLVIDEGDGLAEPQAAQDAGNVRLSVDDARLEYGHQMRDASAADRELYGKLAVSVDWRPQPQWEVKLSGRLDGYDQDGQRDWSEARADYGDSYVRYRGDNIRLTAGAQTVVWGRMDEVPLSDRVSTADLTRFVLDKLEDRRRANPMLRLETNIGEGKLDMVWLAYFRGAELPDQDSIWYPVDRANGRILGIDRADIAPALVQAADIIEDEPNGDGGFGFRYTASPFFGDIGITVANTRRSIPYYRATPAGDFKTVYPRSWAFGADTAVDAMGMTWRAELVYSSDNPVTRTDLSYTSTAGVDWGVGVEMHPGDGDSRVNLQLVGSNLLDSPSVFDRTEAYNLNGEIEVPFDRERWRASFDFWVGLDKKDIFLNPEIAFLGWEPHEFYLAVNYYEGDEQTLGGFHEDHSSINLGWRAKF